MIVRPSSNGQCTVSASNTAPEPATHRRHVWQARASRLWKRYLRLAAVVAAAFGTAMLTLQYFILIPPFAWFAKRAQRREATGWTAIAQDRVESATSQY